LSPTRRRPPEEDEPLLFDLPLTPPATGAERRPARVSVEPVQSDLFATAPRGDGDGDASDDLDGPQREPQLAGAQAPATPAGPAVASLGARVLAGAADVLLHVGVLAGVYLGLIALGVEPQVSHWPALATVLAAFSFLSSVVSLAFWGQTAGMAWRGLQTRDRLQRPLTFRQATLRWAGGLLTFAGAGLPLLLALGGSSLSDWLSRSFTYTLGGGSHRLS
jgi:hypothetical protein